MVQKEEDLISILEKHVKKLLTKILISYIREAN
jgi:hypothetical protein